LQEVALMQKKFLFYICTWVKILLPRMKELLFWNSGIYKIKLYTFIFSMLTTTPLPTQI
jgi:hypothetical protein